MLLPGEGRNMTRVRSRATPKPDCVGAIARQIYIINKIKNSQSYAVIDCFIFNNYAVDCARVSIAASNRPTDVWSATRLVGEIFYLPLAVAQQSSGLRLPAAKKAFRRSVGAVPQATNLCLQTFVFRALSAR